MKLNLSGEHCSRTMTSGCTTGLATTRLARMMYMSFWRKPPESRWTSISTPGGGDVFAGSEIYEALRDYSGRSRSTLFMRHRRPV